MYLPQGYYLDAHQGTDGYGRAFGYIGRTLDGDNWQGYFFTYPSTEATIWTVAQREQVWDSLELASEEGHCRHQIPWRTARRILHAYLRTTFDLRRTPASVERTHQARHVY